MKYKINLNTLSEIEKFNQIVNNIDEDVRLIGKDENGSDWDLSAKSLLGTLVLSSMVKRKSTAKNVDWGTIECVCKRDIYMEIKDFVVV